MAARRFGFLSLGVLLVAGAGALAAQAPGDPTDRPAPVVPSGGAALEFDFPALHIGVAEYPEGPTGVTVFYFPNKAKIAVDARGGAPGTMNTDYLRLGYDRPVMDAVVFAGGSWYGLSAGTGVAEAIKETRSNAGAWQGIAGVVSGIIFDLGERRDNTITPDAALGRAALRAARPGRFPLGAQGAGRLAMQGGYFARSGRFAGWPRSGQGGAFRQVGETKIAVFTVVNRWAPSSIARAGWSAAATPTARTTAAGSPICSPAASPPRRAAGRPAAPPVAPPAPGRPRTPRSPSW